MPPAIATRTVSNGKGGGAMPVPGPGRPTSYTPGVAARICREISLGSTLRMVCEPADMPDKATIHRWIVRDEAGFSRPYAEARESQAIGLGDEIIDTAHEIRRGEITGRDGREAINGYAWAAARFSPKRFGDHKQIELTVSGEVTKRVILCDDRARLDVIDTSATVISAAAPAQLEHDDNDMTQCGAD